MEIYSGLEDRSECLSMGRSRPGRGVCNGCPAGVRIQTGATLAWNSGRDNSWSVNNMYLRTHNLPA
eukprot:SAG31_NODE_31382_length_369_cov_0.388889_1_plen_65_part_10